MIRPIKTEDAEGLISYFLTLTKIDPERVERPEDVKKITIEAEVEWIKKRLELESKGEMAVRCIEKDGKIVGCGEFERLKRWIERHVAEIRFGVFPSEAREAVALVQNLETSAKQAGIEILIYFHLASQKEGLRVMQECGYKEIGRIPGYYKRDNEYIDRLYLSKKL